MPLAFDCPRTCQVALSCWRTLRYPNAQVQVSDVTNVLKVANEMDPRVSDLTRAGSSHVHRFLTVGCEDASFFICVCAYVFGEILSIRDHVCRMEPGIHRDPQAFSEQYTWFATFISRRKVVAPSCLQWIAIPTANLAADIQMAPASTRGYSTSRLHDNDVASLCKMFVSLLLYAYVASFWGLKCSGSFIYCWVCANK